MKRLMLASPLFLTATTTAFAQVKVEDHWVRTAVEAQIAAGAFIPSRKPQ